ncbi:fumarylacetoacetate hydrolase family protein [Nakamurella endophytica]|uniref:Fumarylacetoacetate hydrolase n=1 Tax=Nakamurella endophytica TaxID=1748367 RepID=A0A917ST54_9ACTN|nr:fumarylacetoacetate hydrolase family protein [Nakamurella endophytica]GGL94903.1 fumarylacetoacetate hydrolase [Nakamurella endophytica]
MRIANLAGRAVLVVDGGVVDIESASGGRFGPDPQTLFAAWDSFGDWAATADTGAAVPYEASDLGPPVPAPRQVFAVGLNYREHASEVGLGDDSIPVVFTKFPAAITGPYAEVEHPGGDVDWEVELVAVIGRPGHRIDATRAWDHIAGVTVGQDLSERVLQHAGALPQFSLGKSFPGFAPMGPWLVTPDELADRDDLALECAVNGETMQKSRTSMMIHNVPRLVAELSRVTPLLAGDVIFTGTPAGVGQRRVPEKYLLPGDELVTEIEGIGTMRNRIVGAGGRG